LDRKTYDLAKVSFFNLDRGENLKKPLPRRVLERRLEVRPPVQKIFGGRPP